jgi:hypothetical protein
MPTRKDLRVIQGGKPADAQPSADQHMPTDVAELLERAGRYRRLLARSQTEETSGLADDMEEAINALQRLEESRHPEAERRAAEYRRLVAEIEAEIVAILRGA